MPADEGQRGLGLHIDPKARIVEEHGSAGERPTRQIERRGVVSVRAAEIVVESAPSGQVGIGDGGIVAP